MRIAIYDIAAETGGALSVLMEYYNNALMDKENQYLFILGLVYLENADNIEVLRIPFAKRSWLHRIVYDVLYAHKAIQSFCAEEVISLQNTLVPLCKTRQIVYLHNLLPRSICDARFKLWYEPKLWVYQNIIGRLIISSCKKADGIVVQANWIKKRLVGCGIPGDKITVKRPTTSPIIPLPHRIHSGVTTFFYPASAEPFKNHEVIVEACALLEKQGVDEYRVIFTLFGNESKRIAALKSKIVDLKLPIEFEGWLSHRQMSEIYSQSDCLLFPSKVETFGLPLLEAEKMGLDIIVSDLEYSHETLCHDIQGVSFFPPDNSYALCKAMKGEIDAVLCQ